MTTVQSSIGTISSSDSSFQTSLQASIAVNLNIDNTSLLGQNYVVIDCENSAGLKAEVNGSAQIHSQKTDLGLSGAGSLVINKPVIMDVKMTPNQTNLSVEGQATVNTQSDHSKVNLGVSGDLDSQEISSNVVHGAQKIGHQTNHQTNHQTTHKISSLGHKLGKKKARKSQKKRSKVIGKSPPKSI